MAAQISEIEAARDEALARIETLIPLEAELSQAKVEREGLFQERNVARQELQAIEADISLAQAMRDEALAEAETARKTAHDHEIRVSMAREEFLRSEGQIALIKDLVLREDSL